MRTLQLLHITYVLNYHDAVRSLDNKFGPVLDHLRSLDSKFGPVLDHFIRSLDSKFGPWASLIFIKKIPSISQ